MNRSKQTEFKLRLYKISLCDCGLCGFSHAFNVDHFVTNTTHGLVFVPLKFFLSTQSLDRLTIYDWIDICPLLIYKMAKEMKL